MILPGLFLLGLVALYLGAEWLVLGSSRLARSAGVSGLVVGLTVVAFGTSAPELVVSVLAGVRGQSDVAVGNVVGSNIVNIGLILGVSALIRPMRVRARLVAGEIPVMILVTGALAVLALDGRLGRTDGLFLLVGFGAYLWFVMRAAPKDPVTQWTDPAAPAGGFVEPSRSAAGRWRDIVLVALGLAALVVGAHLLVETATTFARAWGVPELVIGLTVVAIGTSLPELATSVLAAVRGQVDIAIGNVVGSNVFNILCVLGLSAAVRPLSIAPSLLRFEIPVMIGASLLLLPLAWSRLRLEWWEGGLLLLGYVAFTLVVLARSAG